MPSASQEARDLQIVLEAYARLGEGSVMEFAAVLAQVLYLLPQEGSVSYRALTLRFQLNTESSTTGTGTTDQHR